MKVTKTNPIVTYGSKVAGIVPGNFSEIYHFAKQSAWDTVSGKSSTKYLVSFDAVGDDFAKSNIGITGEIDITNDLFYKVWRDKVRQHSKELDDEVKKNYEASRIVNSQGDDINPFSKPLTSDQSINSWKT